MAMALRLELFWVKGVVLPPGYCISLLIDVLFRRGKSLLHAFPRVVADCELGIAFES